MKESPERIRVKQLTLIRFRGFTKFFKYCLYHTIFGTYYGVVYINIIVKQNERLPTDPSVGTNKG
jgi:hypothetical protein